MADLCRTLLEKFRSPDTAKQGIEQRDIVSEDVEFGLPVALKRLMREKGIDPEGRRIRVGNYQITETAYGAVPLTVNGRH